MTSSTIAETNENHYVRWRAIVIRRPAMPNGIPLATVRRCHPTLISLDRTLSVRPTLSEEELDGLATLALNAVPQEGTAITAAVSPGRRANRTP